MNAKKLPVLTLALFLGCLILAGAYVGLLTSYYGWQTTQTVLRSPLDIQTTYFKNIFTTPQASAPVVSTNQTLSTPIQASALPAIPDLTLAPLPDEVFLEPMSHEYQKMNNCGPASLAIAVSYFDINITQFDAARVVKGTPEDKNVRPDEMVNYIESLGLQAIYRVNGTTEIIQYLLSNDIPVIAHQWLLNPQTGELVGHYRTIRGYDQNKGTFISSDSFTGSSFQIPYDQFDEWWRPYNYGYIPVFKPEQVDLAHAILQHNWDDQTNYQLALERSQNEVAQYADNYAYFNLGTNHIALGNVEQAVLAYNQALSFDFPTHFLWYQFSPLETYYLAGNYDRVWNLTDDLLANAGNVEEAYYYRGLVLQAQGDGEETKVEFKKALEANPRYKQAQQALQNIEQ